MRILLIASAFTSLTQRAFTELRAYGHTVALAPVDDAEALRDAVDRHEPQLIVSTVSGATIPRDVHTRHTCLVVHPGPPGDRGPSSLDRALQEGERHWGVTVFQLGEEATAGPLWAAEGFAVPPGVGKSDLCRGEVADAAMKAVLTAVERFASGARPPLPHPAPPVPARPYLTQDERRVDWAAQGTDSVLRTLRAADSQPGVRDELLGEEWFLYGGYAEDRLRGTPGRILATRAGGICRATADGAVWIPELRRRRTHDGSAAVKLPATLALGDRLPDVPHLPAPLELPEHRRTWSDIRYAEEGDVGFVRFRFPGGAMSTIQCRRLLAAWRYARSRPTSVIVLGSERDIFSNGIHLNVIEAAADPAQESWATVNAMNDLIAAVLATTDRLVVAAVPGNAAGGGVMLALAADEVWCRSGAVLNPHYRLLGLYGSEYWTYTLPRRVGADAAHSLMAEAAPVGAVRARELGLVDRVVAASPQEFAPAVTRMAVELADEGDLSVRIGAKKAARDRDESARPLEAYRAHELRRMHAAFFAPDAPYHALRSAFVHKQPAADTAARYEELSRLPQPNARIAADEPVCQI